MIILLIVSVPISCRVMAAALASAFFINSSRADIDSGSRIDSFQATMTFINGIMTIMASTVSNIPNAVGRESIISNRAGYLVTMTAVAIAGTTNMSRSCRMAAIRRCGVVGVRSTIAITTLVITRQTVETQIKNKSLRPSSTLNDNGPRSFDVEIRSKSDIFFCVLIGVCSDIQLFTFDRRGSVGVMRQFPQYPATFAFRIGVNHTPSHNSHTVERRQPFDLVGCLEGCDHGQPPSTTQQRRS